MRFVIESYLPVAGTDGHAAVAARVRAAAAELAREGVQVRHLECVFVAEDELLMVMYEAGSAEVAREAGRRAGISCERVLEATWDDDITTRRRAHE
jgi:hypothetical protein